MYANIRCYTGISNADEKLPVAVRQMASSLSRICSFVSCIALEIGPNSIAVVSIFEDKEGLTDADRMVWTSLPKEIASLLPENPQVFTGEVVFQKGL